MPATASLAHIEDFRAKIKKARDVHGFRFLMVDGPCPPGHKTDPGQSIEIGRLAVESRLFPLFEVKHQKYKLNYKPEKTVPVKECMKYQGRFRQLFKEGNQYLLEEVQEYTDRYWDRLVERSSGAQRK